MKPLLAIDVGYEEEQAYCAGLVFRWEEEKAMKQYTAVVKNIAPYVPGEFYQRELPCIMAIIEQMDLNEISAIIIDGYVQLADDKKGLGTYLYETIEYKVPVIGVAKKSYYQNEANVTKVYRGESNSPLYISAIGIDRSEAAEKIRQMKGAHRIPTILKTVDQLSKNIAITE